MLTLALVSALFPASGITSLAALPTNTGVVSFADGNIARDPAVRTYVAAAGNVGINTSYCNTTNGANDVQTLRITDGLLPTSTASSQAWNCWSSGGGSTPNPAYVAITWPTAQTIDATRVMWWYDGTGSTSGVTLPGNVSVEYWNGSAYVSVANMKNANGAAITYLGNAGNGTTNGNTTWNGATFDPVTTTGLRLSIGKGVGVSVGISEWEVFKSDGEPDPFVTISGKRDSMVVDEEFSLTASVNPVGLSGIQYSWQSSNPAVATVTNNADLISNYETVLRAVTAGTTKITLSVAYEGGVMTDSFDLTVIAHPPSSNIAPFGDVDVESIMGNAGYYTNINASSNPSTTTPSTTNAWVWNSWGSKKGTTDDPYYVTLNFPSRYELESMRIMWWACRAVEAEVELPRNARVEYRDLTTGAWVDAGAVGIEYNGALGNVTLTGSGGWTANNLWNEVRFPATIKTDAIRLRVIADKEIGAITPGFGINRWQVYGWQLNELSSVRVNTVSENTSVVVGFQEIYLATVYAQDLTGVTYEWSIDNANAKIISTDGNRAVLEGVTEGPAKISVKAKHSSGAQEVVGSFDLMVIERKALPDKRATAAGKKPILPTRVVMQGVQFDTPTTHAKGNNGWDWYEEFPNSLMHVTWEAVDPALYAADKAGSKFTVNGIVTYDGNAYPTTCEVTVNAPQPAPTVNTAITADHVRFNDVFWKPKQLVNAFDNLDRAFIELASTANQRNAEAHFVESVKRLSGQPYNGNYNAYCFRDVGIFKTFEGVASTLYAFSNDTNPSTIERMEQLQAKLDHWISMMETVQYPDGYINTSFALRDTSNSGAGGDLFGTSALWRYRYMARHEMYMLGFIINDAVSYTRYRDSAGKPDYRMYDIAKKAADHLVEWFGPDGKRKNEIDGHEGVEMYLMAFANLVEEYEGAGTGQKYRDTAKNQVDNRGNGQRGTIRESGYYPGYSGLRGTYSQDRTPIQDETEVVGHAVRSMYKFCGAADVAISLPESNPDRAAYTKTLTTISDRLIERNTYITGGVGTSQSGGSSEGFGPEYYLSNNQAYAETCANLAASMLNLRLCLLFENAKYADEFERSLYNHTIVGSNLSGGLFYYGSRLENGSAQNRNTWDDIACCQPNLIKIVANIGGYMYGVNKDNVFVNMFVSSNSDINVQGTTVIIDQETNYPWEGAVKLTVKPETEKTFTMNIRIPGWVKAQKYQQATITIDGKAVDSTPNANGYVAITRSWPVSGTVIEMDIPMEIRITEPDNNVHYGNGTDTAAGTNRDKIAIERGPIVYCVETPGLEPVTGLTNDARQVRIPRDIELKATWRNDLLRGVVELTGKAKYGADLVERDIQLIPFYSWNNRGNDPNNMAMGTTGNGCSSLATWLWSLGESTQIRGEKYMLADGESAKLTAVPHVNHNSTAKPASYEWSVIGPAEIVDTAASLTDNTGPGKIGGVGFELPSSVATVKALSPGIATVEVAMKDPDGTVVSTDSYDVEVLGEISVSDSISVNLQSVGQRSASDGTYSNRFMLTPKIDINANMIIAEYDSRGALVISQVRSLDLKAGNTQSEEVTVPRGKKYRIYIWDFNYCPLTKAVTYS